jgi:phage shock protein C
LFCLKKLHFHSSVYEDEEKIMEPKRLFRSRTDVMLGGVCGGLAKYLNVDPTVVRLAFVLLFFIGGGGFWIYLVLWFIMPVEPSSSPTDVVVKSEKVETMPSLAKTGNNLESQDNAPKIPDGEKVKAGTIKNSARSAKPKPGANRAPTIKTDNK